MDNCFQILQPFDLKSCERNRLNRHKNRFEIKFVILQYLTDDLFESKFTSPKSIVLTIFIHNFLTIFVKRTVF